MPSIPKRPSQPSGGKQSISNRSYSPHRPAQSISTGNLEQQSSSSLPRHRHDSIESNSPHRPAQSISTGNLEQQSSSSLPKHRHDSIQSKEEDNRSLLSEMATVKSMTVQPQTAESFQPPKYPERKNRTIQYTAAVNPVRARKQGFLVWVASFGFLNLKSM